MTEFRTPIQAGSSAKYSTTITSGGSNVLAAQVSDVRLTLVDKDEAIINSRDDVSVKNASGGTVTDGAFEMILNNLDTVELPGDTSRTQVRYMHLVFTLVGGATHVHEVLWYVQGNHIPGYD